MKMRGLSPILITLCCLSRNSYEGFRRKPWQPRIDSAVDYIENTHKNQQLTLPLTLLLFSQEMTWVDCVEPRQGTVH